MKSGYYYLSITHTFDSQQQPHAGHLLEFEAKGWNEAVQIGLDEIRAIHRDPDKASIIAASLHVFGDDTPCQVSAHASKRLLVGKIYQPSEWQ